MADLTLLTPDQLAGVYERLKRADENIHNLGVEIGAFLKVSPDSGVADDKRKAAEEWLKFHIEREIPPRFPVLAGEIIHHFRSCLDHIAWLLSNDSYRRTNEMEIAFPILLRQPKDDKEKESIYNRKVKGIAAPGACALIEALQPYKVANPADQALAIISNLDNTDKHRALVLVEATFDALISFPTNIATSRMIGSSLKENEYSLGVNPANKSEVKFSRQVAFAQFGERKRQPVIPSLAQLSHELWDIVRKFGELKAKP
jgi:hypothetical protein